MTEQQRNFAILFAVAVIGFLAFSVFSLSSTIVLTIISLLFFIAISFALWRLYKSREGTIALMDAKWRLLLQVSAVVGYLTLATGLFPPFIFPLGWASYGPAWGFSWFVLLGACVAGIYYSWQQRTTGW